MPYVISSVNDFFIINVDSFKQASYRFTFIYVVKCYLGTT